MSLVVLHHSDVSTIASKRRVIATNEVGTLNSMLEQADLLVERVASEEKRISDAETAGRSEGYDAGFESGKQEGLASAGQQLTVDKATLEDERNQLQQQATQMAFDIVRKLAHTIDPAELLAALAVTAAQSGSPDEKYVLRVYDEHRAAVAEKLASAGHEISSLFRSVIGDGAIDPAACILESDKSRVLADLETQATLLESQLGKL